MNKLTVSGSVALCGWAVLAAGPARAQSAGDKATAEALFSEGRRLMAQSNYRDACPKFEASLRLDRGLGAMLNLADCYEKNGQTASAWAEFREASAAARASGSRDREDLARQRAGALEPKLSRLTITAQPPAQVTRDGTAVEAAVFGTAVPVDPGKHVIEATAPGKQKWAKTVDVAASAARVSVEVPPLQNDPQAGASTTQPPVPPPPGGGVDVAAGTSSPQRTIAIAVGAVGVAGIAAGAFFGLKASSTWKDAKGGCTDYPRGCNPDAAESSQQANNQATIATVGFVAGAVALAGGAVLWFTAPRAPENETKVSFGVGPTGVVVRGGF